MAPTVTANNVTTQVWAAGLLTALKVPVTTNNINNIKTWIHQEQSAGSWTSSVYNPLGLEVNGQVQPFSTVEQGISATAQNLQASPQIIAALKQNAPAPVFASTVINSNWNSNFYKGIGLTNWLSKGPLDAAAAITSSPGNEVSRIIGDLNLPGGGVIQDISSTVTGAGSAVVSTAAATGKLLGNLTSASFWKRVGIFTGGLAMFGVGLTIYISTTKPGQAAIKAIPEALAV